MASHLLPAIRCHCHGSSLRAETKGSAAACCIVAPQIGSVMLVLLPII